MSRLVWTFGWIGVAVWSLICALTYGLFDLLGRGMMRSSDIWSSSPETVEGVFNVFSFLHSFSTGAVLVVWALVSLLILAVPWALDRVIGPVPRGPMPARRDGMRPDGRGGVIDLPPDQYSSAPRPAEVVGVPPRLPGRS